MNERGFTRTMLHNCLVWLLIFVVAMVATLVIVISIAGN